MQSPSRQPISNQPHLHPRLIHTVRKHLLTPSLKPIAPHNANAFELLLSAHTTSPHPVIVDSFCGTGQSTAELARRYPEKLVVGIDKSAHRLGKRPEDIPANCLFLRADCEDLWRLIAASDMKVDAHYILYPNPWPKGKHLQRRVHGSPAFYSLLQMGGAIELRSNWQLYVEEFGLAMHLADRPGVVSQIKPDSALTLFEKKYRESGHDLWTYISGFKTPFKAQIKQR